MVVISHLQSITTIRPVSHYSTCVSEQLAQSHYMPQQLLSQQQCITVILANITLYLVTEIWCEQFAQSYYRVVEPISFDTHSAYDNSCNNYLLHTHYTHGWFEPADSTHSRINWHSSGLYKISTHFCDTALQVFKNGIFYSICHDHSLTTSSVHDKMTVMKRTATYNNRQAEFLISEICKNISTT